MSNRLVLLALASLVLGFTISSAHAGNPCREAARTRTPEAAEACYRSNRSAPHGNVDRSIGYSIAKGDCRRFTDRGEAFEVCRIGYGVVGFDSVVDTYGIAKLPTASCEARNDEGESFVNFVSTIVPFDEMTEKAVCDAFESAGNRRSAVNEVHCKFGDKVLYVGRCGF